MTETIYKTWKQPQGCAVETDYNYDLHCFKLYSNEGALLATSYPMDMEQMSDDHKALDMGDNMMDWDNLDYPKTKNSVEFEISPNGESVEVIVNDETVGTLEQGYEISGPNQDLKQWIFWDNDHQEGTTYGTSLDETLNTIKFELEES